MMSPQPEHQYWKKVKRESNRQNNKMPHNIYRVTNGKGNFISKSVKVILCHKNEMKNQITLPKKLMDIKPISTDV